MTMQFWVLVALALVVVIFGLYLWFVHRGINEPEPDDYDNTDDYNWITTTNRARLQAEEPRP